MWFKNTNNDKNVYLLLDRSGSMAREWKSTLESINGYVKKLEDDVNVFLAAFDSSYGDDWFKVIRKTTAKAFEPVTEYEVSPRGGTPLFDAAGKIMHQMISDNSKKAVLVVMTDGEENSSREYSHSSVMSMIKKLEEKDWPIVYLGAGFKEVEKYAVGTFSISTSNVFNTTAGTREMAMGSLGNKTMDYFNVTVGDSAKTMEFTEEEKALYSGEQPK